jgi:hypothetical protein
MTDQDRRRAEVAAAADRRMAALSAGAGPGYKVEDAEASVPAPTPMDARLNRKSAATKKKAASTPKASRKHKDPDSDSGGSNFTIPATPSVGSSDDDADDGHDLSDSEKDATVLTGMQQEYNELVRQSKKMMTIELRRKMARLSKLIKKREGKARNLTQGERNKM